MEAIELSACAKCAARRRTCCQTCEVLVTDGDKVRITMHTGRGSFWEYRIPSDPAHLEQDDDPNWLAWAFRPDGSRPVLARRPWGDCAFLGPAGGDPSGGDDPPGPGDEPGGGRAVAPPALRRAQRKGAARCESA